MDKPHNSESEHLSDADLIRFTEREQLNKDTTTTEGHLIACAECRKRLGEIEIALTAYDDYQARVLRPSLEAAATVAWPSLGARITAWEGPKRSWLVRPALWWAATALGCCLVLLVMFSRRAPEQREMQQVLEQALSAPEPEHRRLQFTEAGRSWYRPAVLRGADHKAAGGSEHVQALFIEAHYSWEDPLSVRSFAAWRKQLRDKRDEVTAIEGGDGRRQLYRLRTDTTRGVLRRAALTLRAENFAAVKGAFQFADREEVVVSDSGEMPEPQPRPARKEVPSATGRTAEVRVSEADELRVFAALDAIGADVGEPVDVDLDAAKQHVVVTGLGVSATRQSEIKVALNGVPNAVTHFGSAMPRPGMAGDSGDNTGRQTGDAVTPFRLALEEKAGGSVALEHIANQALEFSSSLLAQGYALLVLSEKFTPQVERDFSGEQRETLRRLRQRHAAATEQNAVALRDALKPLIADHVEGTPSGGGASWQAGVAPLFEAVRQVDSEVSRLLGGSYPEEWGRDTVNRLPQDLGRVESFAQAQATAQ